MACRDLAKKLLRGGNFIVFDEPTNDLDRYTLRVLEETIECFEGCALIVSHDRYLLNRLCTHMLIFEAQGAIVQITGNYDDYLLYCERRREDERQKRAQQPKEPRAAVSSEKPRSGLTYKEKQELASMEQRILEGEENVARLHEQVNSPGFYEQDFTETQRILKALEAAEAEVHRLYQRWEELEAGK